MKNMNLHTRREFLRSTLLGGALTWTVPAFLQSTIDLLHAEADGALLPGATGKDAPILVVLQLAGGNDGLNTVVPYANDFYYRARPVLAVPKKDVLRISDETGLHPELTGLKSLYDEGHLAIVHGAGYPNPNRSHFRSTEIWQTASDSDRVEQYGWIGRYFDNQCAGADASVGICIGNESPQSFAAQKPKGVTFQNPQQYKVAGMGPSEEQLFQEMNGGDDAGTSISSLSGKSAAAHEESPIDFLERTSLDAQVSSDQIRAIAAKSTGKGTYPPSKLGKELELVSKLIAGGMSTRVYYVSQGGYDTHTGQQGNHNRLLREFGDALHAFCSDLAAQGNLQRVVVMTFSEFGRRVEENASHGTDHGTAAPLFLAGGPIRAGLHGPLPSLNPKDLDQGDLRHTVDFRSVYATVLEKHLKAPSGQILGRSFPLTDVI